MHESSLAKRTPWIRLCWATGVAPLRGLRPDTNGLQFVPAEGLGHWPGAACKDAEGASGGIHLRMRGSISP